MARMSSCVYVVSSSGTNGCGIGGSLGLSRGGGGGLGGRAGGGWYCGGRGCGRRGGGGVGYSKDPSGSSRHGWFGLADTSSFFLSSFEAIEVSYFPLSSATSLARGSCVISKTPFNVERRIENFFFEKMPKDRQHLGERKKKVGNWETKDVQS